MAILRNTADLGTNGVAVTSGNNGGTGNDALTPFTTSGASAITFSNDITADTGTLVYKIAANAAESAYLEWLPTGSNSIADRVYFYFPAYPSAGNGILRIMSSGGGTTHAQVVLRNDGSFQIADGTGGFPFTSAAGVIPLNTLLRLEWSINNPSTTTGVMNLDWYAGDSSTPIAGASYSTTTGNFGTTQMARVRYGRTAPFGTSWTLYVDSLAHQDGSTTYIGPTVNTPPTVDAGVNQNVGATATVNLTATASDAETSIASILWTFDFPTSGAPSLTGATTLTPSFTSGALGSLYILRCTVTDTDGASAFDTMEVRVPVAGATTQRTVPTSGSGTGSWTNTGGAATEGQALSDESDTTYLQSPSVSAVEVNRRVRITPGAAKSTANLKEKLWTDTGTANTVVRLYEGATLRQSWTQAITSTITEYTFALSAGTVSAISDWGNLFVEVGATT